MKFHDCHFCSLPTQIKYLVKVGQQEKEFWLCRLCSGKLADLEISVKEVNENTW